MDMNNLKQLDEDLKKIAAVDAETAEGSFPDDVELTDEEKEYIENLQKETSVVVSEEDIDGNKSSTPITEYTKSLDEKVAKISNGSDQLLKMINSGDIKKTTEDLQKEARDKALRAFREISVTDEELSDDDYITINDAALAALEKHFNIKWELSDLIIDKLRKMSLRQICEILPPEFVKIYTRPEEVAANNIQAKERLIASVAYLAVTGPEMDYLNNYIDEENKLAVVSKRLLQCHVDFTEMLKDQKKLSEIIDEAQAKCPMDTSFWATYIKMPNRVHSEFAQRVVIQGKYKEAYEKLMADYPAIDLSEYLDDAEKLAVVAKEVAFNEKARKMIQSEIDEANNKIQVYESITDLTLMKELWAITSERFGPNSTMKKKLSLKYLVKEAIDAVDRVRRCKVNLPFPGFKGNERNADQIFVNYISAFIMMATKYNATITEVLLKAEDSEEKAASTVKPIIVEGYKDTMVFYLYGIYLAIIMGRLVKKLTKNDMNKYDAITLDAYFQMFCHIGMDIYLMEEIWEMMKDLVIFSLKEYGDQLQKELK